MKQKIKIKQTLFIFIFLLIPIISFNQVDSTKNVEEMVVTGTLKELKKSDSPIPVEIISFRLLQKNPTPSIFDALGMVNGVKPSYPEGIITALLKYLNINAKINNITKLHPRSSPCAFLFFIFIPPLICILFY
jgi:hypothetical protein